MNHIYRPAGLHDQGWINQNVGWVRAVYAEIDRWNQTPYAQQIRCGLLYRWVGDAWSIADKPAIHEDFRQALSHDYRWRAKPNHDWEFAGEMWGSSAEPEDRDERLLLYPDDLTRVRGIDDTAQSVLRAAGILTYEQLAAMTPVSLQRLIGETELQPQHISSWPEQARMAGAGEWERLSRYQEHVTQQLRGTLD
jgi:hypothetical protein